MKVLLRKERLELVRAQGLVPGIIYGNELESTKIQVDERELVKTYQKNGYARSFEITFRNKKHYAIFKDLQRNPMQHSEILHFDLMLVSEDDVITASVPITLIGREEVENSAGVVIQLLADSLEFEFPVNKGVSSIEVDVSHLKEGDTLTAQEVVVPEGFVLRDEPTKTVVTITKVEVEETEDDEDTEDTEE